MSEFSLSAINERILESSKFINPLIENLEKAVVGQEELLNKIIICMSVSYTHLTLPTKA